MKNVILVRIDDRLIHGQVVTAWLKYFNSDHLLIIDDALANNVIMQRLYKAAAPTGIDLKIMGLEDSKAFLKSNEGGDDVIILIKTPEVIEAVINEGISVPKVILGGMGSNPNRTQFIKNVFASKDEKESLKRILNNNVDIQYQLVPDDKPINISELL